MAVTWVTALGPHPRDRLCGRGIHLSYLTHTSTTRGDICTIDTVWRDQRDLGILPSCRGRACDNLGVTGRWEELKGLHKSLPEHFWVGPVSLPPGVPCSRGLGDQKSAWGGGHQFHNHPQSSGVYDASLGLGFLIKWECNFLRGQYLSEEIYVNNFKYYQVDEGETPERIGPLTQPSGAPGGQGGKCRLRKFPGGAGVASRGVCVPG